MPMLMSFQGLPQPSVAMLFLLPRRAQGAIVPVAPGGAARFTRARCKLYVSQMLRGLAKRIKLAVGQLWAQQTHRRNVYYEDAGLRPGAARAPGTWARRKGPDRDGSRGSSRCVARRSRFRLPVPRGSCPRGGPGDGAPGRA